MWLCKIAKHRHGLDFDAGVGWRQLNVSLMGHTQDEWLSLYLMLLGRGPAMLMQASIGGRAQTSEG